MSYRSRPPMCKELARRVASKPLASRANAAYREGMGTTYGDLFAANLRAARARAGIAQTTVADRMNRLGFEGWDGSKVSRAERGKTPVEVADLLGLAICLGCTLRDLVGEAAPDAQISFADPALEVTGVHVRNSGYGWNDASVSWHDDEISIAPPASMSSAFARDRSPLLAAVPPDRFARTA
jgi:transcriptional regulator with XRE-family HTH domain